jgi:hypothetical protein
MQIREKGKKILCIRTEYRPKLRRTVGVTVATQDRYMTTVCEEVCRKLTETEVDQLNTWLSERKNRQSVASLKSSLSFVAYAVCQATEALTVDGLSSELTTEKANRIWLAMEEFQKALKKAGFKRPCKPLPAKVDDRNYDLLNTN